MYKIIGGDSKEYGPVSFDQLCQWITEGRANADSLIQNEGAAEWKPLGSFPEFGELLHKISPTPATQAPISNASGQASGSPTRPGRLEIGQCFAEAWRVMMKQPVLVFATAGVIILINLAAEKLLPVEHIPFPFNPRQSMPVPILFSLFSLVFEGVFHGVVYAFYLKLIRGEWTSVNGVLEQLKPCWLALVASSIVSNILVGLGFLLLIIPGIYLAVSWAFTYLVIVDQKAGFWTAMSRSRRAVGPHFWPVFALFLLLGILIGIGALIHPYTRFVLLPFAALAVTSAYESVGRSAPSSSP